MGPNTIKAITRMMSTSPIMADQLVGTRRVSSSNPLKRMTAETWRRCDQNLNKRFTLMTRTLFVSSGKLRASVSRCSFYTTNNSLPGRYSHRRRTFAPIVSLLELYWTNELTNIRGVIV